MTREEIEKRMDKLARKYVETRDHEIIEELYKLRLELNRVEKSRRTKNQGLARWSSPCACQGGLPMTLRKHPLLNYRGLPSWPPVWTFTGGLKNGQPRREEIGILKEVMISNVQPADRCFLHIEHKGSTYVGCLLIEDQAFCAQIVTLLQDCLNRPIAEIGSLDLSHTL
jgi:hypothetical protein